MENMTFEEGVGFSNMRFDGIRIGDSTLVKKGTVWSGGLPEKFTLSDSGDSGYQQLVARIGNYKVDKDADD
jgi:hypothetical protein